MRRWGEGRNGEFIATKRRNRARKKTGILNECGGNQALGSGLWAVGKEVSAAELAIARESHEMHE